MKMQRSKFSKIKICKYVFLPRKYVIGLNYNCYKLRAAGIRE